MGFLYVPAVLFLLGSGTAPAATAESVIKLPAPPAPKQPDTPPAPAPGEAVRLAAGEFYAFTSTVECSVRSYPPGRVEVLVNKGPRSITAQFVYGGGKYEDRDFDAPFVYRVRGTGVGGETTLVVTPFGLKSDADIVTVRMIAPGETPVPIPPVNPPVTPPVNPPVTPVVVEREGMFVVIIEETGQAVATRGSMLTDKTLASHMWAKKEKFRVVDQNVVTPDGTPPADVVRFLDQCKGKTLPRIFFTDSKGNQLGEGVPCPTTAQGILDLLKKNGG